MPNRIFLALVFLCYLPAAKAQQPAKFKTASAAQKEDSLYQTTLPPAVKDTMPKKVIYKHSRDTAAWGALATLGLVFVLPQGELADITVQGFGYGFQSSILVNPARRRNPFAWERRKVNVYGGAGVGYLTHGGIKDMYSKSVDSSVQELSSLIINSTWTFDVIGRLEVLKGPIKLFVEGSWGGSLFAAKQTLDFEERTLTAPDTYTVTKVKQTTGTDREWVGHYSYGGGFRTGTELFKLEFKFINHIGQSVTYIDPKTVGYNASTKELTYATRKVSSNYWLPQVAASYLF